MKIFLRALFPAILVIVFLLALVAGGPGNPVDVAAIRLLAAIRSASSGMTGFAIGLTFAGSAYATIGLGVLVTLWLLLTGEKARALLLAGGIAGERLVADSLKWLIDRPRPAFDVHPVATSSSAFPSGHAANSMAVFVMVALIATPSRFRTRAVALAVILSLAVGATRPYLGVHWPSDVIGGWALGLLAAWTALRVGERSAILTVEAQHQIIGRHRATINED